MRTRLCLLAVLISVPGYHVGCGSGVEPASETSLTDAGATVGTLGTWAPAGSSSSIAGSAAAASTDGAGTADATSGTGGSGASSAAADGNAVDPSLSPGLPTDSSGDNPPANGDTRDADNPATGSTIDPLDGQIDPGLPPDDGGASGVDTRPLAYAQRASVERDRPATIVLAGGSERDSALTFLIANDPTSGTLSPVFGDLHNWATVRYTPAEGFLGTDSFSYVVSDGVQASAAATVTVNVAPPPNELPACCTEAYFDADRNLVINGDRAFPVGFWAIMGETPPEGWDGMAEHFATIVNGGRTRGRNGLVANAGLHLMATGNLQYFGGSSPFLSAWAVTDAMCDEAIIAWEVIHEPDQYAAPDPRANVAQQAELIRAADSCKRPVVVTPQASAGAKFTEYAQHVDFTMAEYYPSPQLALGAISAHLDNLKSWIGAQPFAYVYSIEGYQPMRYRRMLRAPTAAETRAAAYQAVVRGAKGFLMYPHSQAGTDPRTPSFSEPNSAQFCVTDSPAFYAELQQLADELHQNKPLFTAPLATATALVDSTAVRCAVWDVNGSLPGGEYLVCVNSAESPSPYFVFTWPAERVRAYALTPDGRTFPRTPCNDAYDNNADGVIDLADSGCFGPEDETESSSAPVRGIEMQPQRVYLKELNTGIWNVAEEINRVRIYFETVAPDAQFEFAIYADSHRDGALSQLLYRSGWLTIPGTGWVESALPASVTLEHTREYFLAVHVDRPGVFIHSQELPRGIVAKPATTEFLESFPPLFTGQSVTATVSLAGGTFGQYLVTRHPDDEQTTRGAIDNNQIVDTFEPYAVHIYQLLP